MTRLVGWLVQGNVAAIEEYTKGRRLSADLLQQAVSDYERKLVMPPHIADVLDAIEVRRRAAQGLVCARGPMD